MAQQGTPGNRTPLAELSIVAGTPVAQRTSPQPGVTAATTPMRNVLTPRLIGNTADNIPDSILTPTLSPEEMVIRQRGRRRRPVIWSPDAGSRARVPSPMKTPTKNGSSMTLRSSPRKRLLMHEFADFSPSKNSPSSPSKPSLKARTSVGDSPGTSPKRPRVEQTPMGRRNEAIPLETTLKGYSRDQLIAIVTSLVAQDERLKDIVRRDLPLPDIAPLDGELGRIRKNILASVPNQKIFSRTDGHGFLRAATHLATFKQTVYYQSQNLFMSRHWDALLDYVLMAWAHVRDTPVYEHAKHNATRRYCFKLLSHHASCALKHGGSSLGTGRVGRFQQKLPGMVADWAEIGECGKCIEYIMKGM